MNIYRAPSTPASSLTTVNNDDGGGGQCNSEDEYEQASVKYDRNNLNEVRGVRKMISPRRRCFRSL